MLIDEAGENVLEGTKDRKEGCFSYNPSGRVWSQEWKVGLGVRMYRHENLTEK